MTEVSLPTLFGALADPTRLAIVERLLSQGEQSVGEIAAPFAMSLPAVSKHLRVLEDAGLLERRIERQWRICRVNPRSMRVVEDWLARYRRFWDVSFDRLERIFDEEEERGVDDA